MNSIKRLSFRLPDFTRYCWVSDHAKSVWEPRIQQILNAWSEIEWLSVAAGLRQCTLRLVSSEQLINITQKMATHELAVLPLRMQATSTHPYCNTALAYQEGKPFNYQIVIGRINDLARFKSAYDNNNQEEIGTLLGYPSCCCDFFQKTWVEEQFIDTTWPMASNTAEPLLNDNIIEVEGPIETNILLRWMGIRAVPHLPCSFNCQSTVEKAQQYLALGEKFGYTEEMTWLTEMLSWPIEWSGLHGIAEIKTPVVKISSCTDATSIKYIVRWKGNTYPEEGARGLVFPYKQPKHRLITDSKSFKEGLASINKADSKVMYPDWYHLDNGFLSQVEMYTAHKPIVKLAVSKLAGQPGTIFDLGCGNGALLKRIIQINKDVIPYGIEKDPNRVANIQQLIPNHMSNFVVGDIFETEKLRLNKQKYTIVLLMPGRFIEASSEQVKRLKQWIKECSLTLLVYAYGDWLTKYGGLAALSEKAGLYLLEENNNTGIAKII